MYYPWFGHVWVSLVGSSLGGSGSDGSHPSPCAGWQNNVGCALVVWI